jgi:DNA-binding winged helix-turn-helix (wHTH) protein
MTSSLRFGPFVLSRARRVVVRDGVEVPLIPRYFDLLVLLVGERHRAVSKQEIFDVVWKDVIVSDGALSQAIRTIRRALDDDPREPTFVKTVSRHGYQFIFAGVVEVEDAIPTARQAPIPATDPVAVRRALIQKLTQAASLEERREAAEQLHAMGTAEALVQLDQLPGHETARALLRDSRWDVAGAGAVPLVGSGGAIRTVATLAWLRLRRAARIASSRWVSASLGGAAAGLLAGAAGGIAFLLVPESQARLDLILALGLVGAAAGAMGAAGVGAGLAAAEAIARSRRALALAAFGAAGGGFVGAIAHVLARALLSGVFGRELGALGGGLEGLVIGGAAGIGYAASTAFLADGGMAAPRGATRARTVLVTGLACAVAGVGLTLAGRHLISSSLDAMASGFSGSQVGLAPLARLLGEGTLRPITGAIISAFEGLMFGGGLAFGLTHRPRRS